jgi:uncharacterized protein YecE (DUF72 family)
MTLYVGIAGWALRKEHLHRFPAEGTHLQRYAARFSCVEINSSFYRPHRPQTYARWSASVPEAFRFAVKVPRRITHERRLGAVEGPVVELLDTFLAECTALGPRLGPLLVQLPPSLALDLAVADAFFAAVRDRFGGAVVCEPRHATWFTPEGEQLLLDHEISRVAADPPCVPAAAEPAGDPRLVYFRLHGSPRIYYSPYDPAYLDRLAEALRAHASRAADVWCIFDNTALGYAYADAFELMERLGLVPNP